jgi:thiol:disulfide interchange protein
VVRPVLGFLGGLLLASPAWAAGEKFDVVAERRDAGGATELAVAFRIPAGHRMYADQMTVEPADGVRLTARDVPPPKRKFDPLLDAEANYYDHDVTFVYTVEPPVPDPLKVIVGFQGCDENTCFLPETRELRLGAGVTNQAAQAEPAPTGADGSDLAPIVAGRASGYLPAAQFVAFLDEVESGAGAREDSLAATLDAKGLWVTLFLILLGGLALNLTPCVLPMIPVNIAIIGAGAQAGSRGRGFALGSAYGAGIALVYGVLGLVVVLSQSPFGVLNSSPWFNVAIALLFIVLGLGMFDVIPIDFSRFQGGIGPGASRKGTFGLAFFMGGVAALLAGACVAPVVISVLLLAARLRAEGQAGALLLPFVLGIGMAMPWPFAGAGLSFLPRPGGWMTKVKHTFGVIILCVAAYYGYQGVNLFRERGGASDAPESGSWLTSLDEGLRAAAASGKPLLVDFWATWCTNCKAMERTTLRNPDIVRRLDRYVKVKFQAEDPRNPATREILERYGVRGLPTFLILRPGSPAPTAP